MPEPIERSTAPDPPRQAWYTSPPPDRPWSRLITEELLETEGVYADFVAWEHWMLDNDHEDLLEPFETVQRVELYALCCTLWDRKGETI